MTDSLLVILTNILPIADSIFAVASLLVGLIFWIGVLFAVLRNPMGAFTSWICAWCGAFMAFVQLQFAYAILSLLVAYLMYQWGLYLVRIENREA